MNMGISFFHSSHGDFCCNGLLQSSRELFRVLQEWTFELLNMGISSSAMGCSRVESFRVLQEWILEFLNMGIFAAMGCCSKVGSFLEFLQEWTLEFLNMGISSSAVGCERMEWLP